MIIAEDKVAQLQKWILEEAYKGGLARLNKKSDTDESRSEKSSDYFIHRHDIYQRYFKLPNDPLRFEPETGNEDAINYYRQVRLRSAVILCESVRELLKNRLIQFLRTGFPKESQMGLPKDDPSFIFLTEAGVSKAESFLSTEESQKSQDRTERRSAA
jgi:hypothetical protein